MDSLFNIRDSRFINENDNRRTILSENGIKALTAFKSTMKAMKFIKIAKHEPIRKDSELNGLKAFRPKKNKVSMRPTLVTRQMLDNPIDFNNLDDQKLVLKILIVRPHKRYDEEVLFLKSAFEDLNTFKQMKEDLDEFSFKKVFKALKLESFKAGQKVINYGDFGMNFYILIRGSVYVLIKPTKLQSEKPVKADESDEDDYKVEVGPVLPSKEETEKFWKENRTDKEKKEMLEKCFPDFVLAKEMFKGESFGEIALNVLGDRKRMATVVCKEDSLLGTLSFADYQNILGDVHEKKNRDNTEFLSSIDIFRTWKDEDYNSLIPVLEEMKFTRNQIIFKEGDVSDRIYFVRRGEVELQKNTRTVESLSAEALSSRNADYIIANLRVKQAKPTKSMRLTITGRGGCFGEAELLSFSPRDYTVVVYSTEVVVSSITRDRFMAKAKPKYIKSLEQYLQQKKSFRQEMISRAANLNETLDSPNPYEDMLQQSIDSSSKTKPKAVLLPLEAKPLRMREVSGLKYYPKTARNDSPGKRSNSNDVILFSQKPIKPISKALMCSSKQNENILKLSAAIKKAPPVEKKEPKIYVEGFMNRLSNKSPKSTQRSVKPIVKTAVDNYDINKIQSARLHSEGSSRSNSIQKISVKDYTTDSLQDSMLTEKQKFLQNKPMLKLIKSLGLNNMYKDKNSVHNMSLENSLYFSGIGPQSIRIEGNGEGTPGSRKHSSNNLSNASDSTLIKIRSLSPKEVRSSSLQKLRIASAGRYHH